MPERIIREHNENTEHFERLGNELTAEMRKGFGLVMDTMDGVRERLNRLERDAATGELEDRVILGQISELRYLLTQAHEHRERQQAELDARMAAMESAIQQSPREAARGAIQGAAEAFQDVATPVIEKVASTAARKTQALTAKRFGAWVAAGAAGFVGLLAALREVPAVISYVDRVFIAPARTDEKPKGDPKP